MLSDEEEIITRLIQDILQELNIKKIEPIKPTEKTRYIPIKNCSSQQCYKALYEINKIIGNNNWE